MRAIEVEARDAAVYGGALLCHNVVDPKQPKRILARKGSILDDQLARTLAEHGDITLHLLLLDPDDVREDEAGRRLANAVAAGGVVPRGESESQVELAAAERGLLRVDTGRLLAINQHDGVTVWTLPDAVPVEAGQHVASAKVAPLAIPSSELESAESAAGGAIVRVEPYRPRRVAVLARERLGGVDQQKFERVTQSKLAWFCPPRLSIRYCGPGAEDAVDGLQACLSWGPELVLVGGTGSTDPLDAAIVALERLGGRLLRRGIPAHPGSTYWLGDLGGRPVLGLASCGAFSRMTALDLLLPRFFAGEEITVELLLSLAEGGLLNRGQAYRFPSYERPAE